MNENTVIHLIKQLDVTDLSGESMDEYVSKLTDMGAEVAKTGKLWTGARVMGW